MPKARLQNVELHEDTNVQDISNQEIQLINSSLLSIDKRYQREVIKSHYRRIAAKLNINALHVISVSARSNGDLIVIDGQHRLMAVREAGLELDLLCRVYIGLTLEEEAALFRNLNRTRKGSAWNDFYAGLTERDEECLAIKDICENAGWSIGNQSKDGVVCCVTTLRTIYRGKKGPENLLKALEDAKMAWGLDRNGVEKNVLYGLAYIHQITEDYQLNRGSLVQKLSKISPSTLLARAKSDTRVSIPLYKLCSSAIINLYNQGKRTNRIPDV